MISDYNVTITIRNNYLLSAMRSHGLETAADLSRLSGVPQSEVGEYLNLKKTPYSTKGLRPGIERISKFLKKLPEDLFPPQHLNNSLIRNRTEVVLDRFQVEKIIWKGKSQQQKIEFTEAKEQVFNAIASLSAREQEVLRLRFGFDGHEWSLDEIAKKNNISRERIRQIEKKALIRLRYHTKREQLKEAFNSIVCSR